MSGRTLTPESGLALKVETGNAPWHAGNHQTPLAAAKGLSALVKPLVQPKLSIGASGDKYEQEADRVADRIMRTPAAGETPPPVSSCGPGSGLIRRKCVSCDAEYSQKEQRHPLDEKRRCPKCRVQAKARSNSNPGGAGEVTVDFARGVQALRGGGRPLPESTRAFFESRFGHDFSRVRIHADARAAVLAKDINAKAFTSGNDVVFGAGAYQPHSHAGRHLLAHEMTHTLQQRGVNRIQRAPGDGAGEVTKVVINLSSGVVKVYLDNRDTPYVYQLSRSRTYLKLGKLQFPIPAGKYEVTHDHGKNLDHIDFASQVLPKIPQADLDQAKAAAKGEFNVKLNYWFTPPKNSNLPEWDQVPRSEFTLEFLDPSGTGGSQTDGSGTGKKEEGRGSGAGEGVGDKSEDKTKKRGDKSENADDGQTGSGDSELSDEERKLLEDFFKEIAELGSSGKPTDAKAFVEKLKKLDEQERKEFIRFLKDNQFSDDDKANKFDEVLDAYTNMSEVEREVWRTNLSLAEEANLEQGIPETVSLNISDAVKENASAEQQVNGLNKHLNKILSKVADDNPHKKELEPIDLSRFPFFNEVMMFQGLLAGAAQRSEGIAEMARELNGNVGKLRSYIIEEIQWLTMELAAGSVISALLAPVSAGASLAIQGGRAAMLLYRLNKLRKLIQAISKAYDVYNNIVSAIDAVTGAFGTLQKLRTFLDEMSDKKEKLRSLEAMLQEENLDPEQLVELDFQYESLKTELVNKIQEKLESELAPILERFYFPDDLTGDALIEEIESVMLNIPAGIAAFKELTDFYQPSRPNDENYATRLSLKGVKAGALLYPFVGYLAGEVNDALSSLTQEKSLLDRFGDLFSSLTFSGRRGRHKSKKAASRNEKLKQHRRNQPEKKKSAKDVDTKKSKSSGLSKKIDYSDATTKANVEAHLNKYAKKFETLLEAEAKTDKDSGIYKGIMTESFYRYLVDDYADELRAQAKQEKVKVKLKAKKSKKGKTSSKRSAKGDGRVEITPPPFKIKWLKSTPSNYHDFKLHGSPESKTVDPKFNELDFGDFSTAIPYDQVPGKSEKERREAREAIDKWLNDNGYAWVFGVNESGRRDSSRRYLRRKGSKTGSYLAYADGKLQQGNPDKEAYRHFLGKVINSSDDLPPGYFLQAGDQRNQVAVKAGLSGMKALKIDDDKYLVDGSANQAELPPTHVEHPAGKASWVKAAPLTKKKGNTTGSDKTGSVTGLPGWELASLMNTTERNDKGRLEKNWVKAHLLNAQMHGPAVGWNLVTATKTLNNRMRDEVEEKANKQRAQGDVLYYHTKVDYHPAGTITAPGSTITADKSDFPSKLTIEWGRLKKGVSIADKNSSEYRDKKHYDTAEKKFDAQKEVRLPNPGGVDADAVFAALKEEAGKYYFDRIENAADAGKQREACKRSSLTRHLWSGHPERREKDKKTIGAARYEQLYEIGLGKGKPDGCYSKAAMSDGAIKELIKRALTGVGEGAAISAGKVREAVNREQTKQGFGSTSEDKSKRLLESLVAEAPAKVCSKRSGKATLYYLC